MWRYSRTNQFGRMGRTGNTSTQERVARHSIISEFAEDDLPEWDEEDNAGQ